MTSGRPKLRPDASLEVLNARSPGRLPGLIGMEVTALQPGKLRSRLQVRPEIMATNGYLHAASVVALADTSCGYGTLAHLPEGAKSFTTIELKSNFLGTVREGVVICEAAPHHLGRNTQVWDAVVTDEATGKKLALFRCTQMILWDK
jgi:uncharacterized protein (TIGR00369 family)